MTDAAAEQLPELNTWLTREELVRYAGASWDFNPIHYSEYAATDLGMPTVIAQGMLTMGVALRVATEWCGDPARVRSYSFRFTAPVPVPDDVSGAEVRFRGEITDRTGDVDTIKLTGSANEKVIGEGEVQLRRA